MGENEMKKNKKNEKTTVQRLREAQAAETAEAWEILRKGLAKLQKKIDDLTKTVNGWNEEQKQIDGTKALQNALDRISKEDSAK